MQLSYIRYEEITSSVTL